MIKLVAQMDRSAAGTEDRSPLGTERKTEEVPQNKIALFGFRDLDTTGDALALEGRTAVKSA